MVIQPCRHQARRVHQSPRRVRSSRLHSHQIDALPGIRASPVLTQTPRRMHDTHVNDHVAGQPAAT